MIFFAKFTIFRSNFEFFTIFALPSRDDNGDVLVLTASDIGQ